MKIEGRVENLNIGEHFFNFNVVTENKKQYNIKANLEDIEFIQQEKIYIFEVDKQTIEDKTFYQLIKYHDLIDGIEDEKVLLETLAKYYPLSPLSLKESKEGLTVYLNKINNKVLSDITLNIYNKFKKKFHLYPAAVKFHHAYIGGLAQHTLMMLKLAEAMLDVYTYLNKDLVYSAIILHDICKVVELSGVDANEYTKEGQLIGHLVMATYEVIKCASKLGYENSEEVLLLNHILLSHHGLPNFGAAKRPQTAEALLVWYIDSIDSKFEVIKQELEKIEAGTFTSPIAVADRTKIYKHNLK